MNFQKISSFGWLFIGFCLGILTSWIFLTFFAYSDSFGKINLNTNEQVTLKSSSPNDLYRVVLIDRTNFIDRNFDLLLQQRGEKALHLFHSPDVGKPPGSERVLWSSDSSQFILVGRHFFIQENLERHFKLKNGEIIYLLYDAKTRQLYCHQSRLPEFNCLPLPSNAQSIKEKFGIAD
jgi:hypothetical protein